MSETVDQGNNDCRSGEMVHANDPNLIKVFVFLPEKLKQIGESSRESRI
jgi:hypothetical protein